MRGGLIVAVSVLSLSLFSLCLLCSTGLFQAWLFLELLSLSAVPLFFLSPLPRILGGLFSYLLISGLASCFILVGVFLDSCIYFSLFGLLLKFGVFPLYMWVYEVVSSSNWCVVWVLSTYLKIPIFVIYYLFGSEVGVFCMAVISFIGLIVLSFLFWFCTYDLYHCWCHMMLSSTMVMVLVSFSSFDGLWLLFVFYFVWSSLVLLCVWSCSKPGLLTSFYSFLLCGVVMAFPVSIGVFYKLFLGYCLFSCCFPVFCAWVVYSISEQLYLLNLIINCDLVRSDGILLKRV